MRLLRLRYGLSLPPMSSAFAFLRQPVRSKD
jgi:hypothetical protein